MLGLSGNELDSSAHSGLGHALTVSQHAPGQIEADNIGTRPVGQLQAQHRQFPTPRPTPYEATMGTIRSIMAVATAVLTEEGPSANRP